MEREKPSVRIELLRISLSERVRVFEEEQFLRIDFPKFRTVAKLKLRKKSKRLLERRQHLNRWKCGWIQANEFHENYNCYGDLGYSTIKLPNGLVNDSYGDDKPWYNGSIRLKPYIQRYSLALTDGPQMKISWFFTRKSPIELKRCYTKQQFLSWLCLMDCATSTVSVLITIRWSVQGDIRIDPTKPFGSRVLSSEVKKYGPKLLERNVQPTSEALNGISANDAQRLVCKPGERAPLTC